jgi:hypothetical protein
MRKHPMSHILVDSRGVAVHHSFLPRRLLKMVPWLQDRNMLKRAILILPLLACLVGSLTAGQNSTPSVPSAATPTAKNISFAWAESDGVHLGAPQWADDWVRKNAKNFPAIRFSQTPVSGVENYLVVFSASTSVLSGFQPVLRISTRTTTAGVSGHGTATDTNGSMWSYTYSGTATATTTTMTTQDVPYTIDLHTLFASVYGGPGNILISRHSESIGRQQGGDSTDAVAYNLGQLIRRIRLKTRLLNAVAKDVVKAP